METKIQTTKETQHVSQKLGTRLWRFNLLVPETVITAIWRIIDYSWAVEKKDFETQRENQSNYFENHIFRDLDLVNNWLMRRWSMPWLQLGIIAAIFAMFVFSTEPEQQQKQKTASFARQ